MIRLALLGMLLATAAPAATCAERDHDGRRYTICTVDAASERIEIFFDDAAGAVYGEFTAIARAIPGTLGFAMNAGMYHPDRAPVGLLIDDGVEVMRLVPNAGPGNFGLLPNGVFCIRDGRADVIETLAYAAAPPACREATQSGPMLVIEGALHPRFLPGSTSRLIRNGVGTSDDGTSAVFAISNEPVTLHEFARLFRDGLGLNQALYFDGRISRLHAPAIGRSDGGVAMGPIVGVVD